MKLMHSWFVFFLLSIILLPQFASAIGLEAAVGAWKHEPEGDIAYKGTVLSLQNDMKYSEKTKFLGRAKIDMPLIIPNIYFMATPMSFDETGSKNSDFTFGDKTFTGNVDFVSKIKIDHYDIALYYGLPFVKAATLGKLNLDAGVNFRIIHFKAEIIQASTHESKNLTIPIPMGYVSAQVKLIEKLSLEAEMRGLTYNSNHYYDLIGRAKYKVVGPAFLSAGYRYEDLKIGHENVKANIRFKGPFAEIGIEF